jgi:hypothetical protein
MESKLSNNEIIVLRLLYSKEVISSEIPVSFFSSNERNNLLNLDLIIFNEELDQFELTEKAINVIETGGYIIKYPMHNEDGVVLNYKDVLDSCSSKSAKALGLSIINTQFYKKWGKYNNLILYKELDQARDYYRNFEHPIAKIESFKIDIDIAESKYERILQFEMIKIKDFTLSKPLFIGITIDGHKIELLKIIDSKTSLFKIGNNEPIILNTNDNIDFYLSKNHKHQIIRQYYIMKSKPN